MAGDLSGLLMRLSMRVARYEAAEDEARAAAIQVRPAERACACMRLHALRV